MAMLTIFVSNMEQAVRFYTEALGWSLASRFGDEFAIIKDEGLTIGLHPASPQSPAGKMTIGLEVSEPLENAVASMKAKGVKFHGAIVEDPPIRAAHFEGPDGSELYLAEVRPWQQ